MIKNIQVMKIREIKENKKEFLELLLLADEQEDMIDRYLDEGEMFIMEQNRQAVSVCVCLPLDHEAGILEIKNLAVHPSFQRQGSGRQMIDFIAEKYRDRYKVLQVGTGDSPLTIPFYRACGFRESHRIKDFFTKHYDHPIYEDGVKLTDMVCLRKSI